MIDYSMNINKMCSENFKDFEIRDSAPRPASHETLKKSSTSDFDSSPQKGITSP